MIIYYNPEGKCIPQGIDVSEESKYSNEKGYYYFLLLF